MSKVMQVLAQMGSDATCQSDEAIQNLLITTELEADITDAMATAIINKDVISLERQLDVCSDIVCTVVTPNDDDDEKEDKDSTEETSNNVIGF